MSSSKGREGLSPHLLNPFLESASVQTSPKPKGITYSSKRCDVYRGDHSEIRKVNNKTTLLSMRDQMGNFGLVLASQIIWISSPTRAGSFGSSYYYLYLFQPNAARSDL